MRITRNTILYIFLLLLSLAVQKSVVAQCSTTINVFPYNEGFENNEGNWSAGSTVHWQWGSPSGKVEINNAGGGSKCWIAGGLTGSSYSSGSSELLSPCFNFSTLVNPEISFKVFWETELKYDGVTLQYSTDAGGSWITLGSENSNNPCQGIENWFNYSPVYFLNSNPGWSGNVQSGSGSCFYGQGSGQWLTARHNLSGLGGQSNVIFKFIFGAGTICNGFDGFGLDDILIGEAPAVPAAAFTYNCGANNTAQFTNTVQPCQAAWNWDFGDPASGPDNFSTQENPVHIFSSAGTYSVSLTVTYGSGALSAAPPANVTVLDITTVNTNVRCNGEQNGSITVNVSPPGVYNYNWNTSPAQNTATISNLSGNTVYTVTVSSANACTASIPVTLIEPGLLTIAPVASPAKCGNNNGSITANAAGGTEPYLYVWSNGQSTPVISGLDAGSYNLSVTDINGCIVPPVNNIQVTAVTYTLIPNLGKDTTICPGQTLLLKPGQYATYKWQDNSTSSSYAVTKTGTYAVEVTDAFGCTGSASINVTVDCKGIYFPSAFTPNADGINPAFGAIGDLGSLKNYSIVIYNRYAEVIFTSSDPYKKWDGSIRGIPVNMGSYIWTAKYTLRSQQPVFKKGSVLVIR